MMDFKSLSLSKKYTADTADGLGAIKGAPCTVKNVEDVENGKKITLEWTGTSGAKQTQSFILSNGQDGQDGITPTVTIDAANKHFIINGVDTGIKAEGRDGRDTVTDEAISSAVSAYLSNNNDIQSAVADEITRIIGNAPEDLDTLKEIADWITTHADSASAMNTAIQENAAAIEELQASVGSGGGSEIVFDETFNARKLGENRIELGEIFLNSEVGDKFILSIFCEGTDLIAINSSSSLFISNTAARIFNNNRNSTTSVSAIEAFITIKYKGDFSSVGAYILAPSCDANGNISYTVFSGNIVQGGSVYPPETVSYIKDIKIGSFNTIPDNTRVIIRKL